MTARDALYASPTCPLGKDVVVIAKAEGADALMVSVRWIDWVCAGLPESVTEKVSGLALAAADGVPVIAPVAGFRLMPAGSVPEVRDQV